MRGSYGVRRYESGDIVGPRSSRGASEAGESVDDGELRTLVARHLDDHRVRRHHFGGSAEIDAKDRGARLPEVDSTEEGGLAPVGRRSEHGGAVQDLDPSGGGTGAESVRFLPRSAPESVPSSLAKETFENLSRTVSTPAIGAAESRRRVANAEGRNSVRNHHQGRLGEVQDRVLIRWLDVGAFFTFLGRRRLLFVGRCCEKSRLRFS